MVEARESCLLPTSALGVSIVDDKTYLPISLVWVCGKAFEKKSIMHRQILLHGFAVREDRF